MSPQKTLQIGVIGAGFISQIAHLHAFSQIKGVRLASIAEPHDGLRAAVAARYAIATQTPDYRALLDDAALDAVVVCMPRRAQAGIVAAALEAKSAVLSEKPMAMTVAEASGLVERAVARKRIWTVGYMKRFDPGVLRYRALLQEVRDTGRFGRVLDVAMRDFCLTYGVPSPPHVRRSGPRPVRFPEGAAAPAFVRAEQRGDYEYTINVASHDINLLRFLFPETLSARAFTVRAGGVQHAVVNAGAFDITLAMGPADMGRWDQRLDVTFERGRLSLVLPSPLSRQEAAHIVLTEGGRTEDIFVPHFERIWAFEAQARAFADAVGGQAESSATGLDGLADLILIERLWNIVDWQQ